MDGYGGHECRAGQRPGCAGAVHAACAGEPVYPLLAPAQSIRAVAKNERFYDSFNLFEEAQIFRSDAFGSAYDPQEMLPVQRRHIAGAFAGAANDVTGLFRTAKGVPASMPRYTHMEAYTFRRVEQPVRADEVSAAQSVPGETRIGDLALLSKKVSTTCGIRNRRWCCLS